MGRHSFKGWMRFYIYIYIYIVESANFNTLIIEARVRPAVLVQKGLAKMDYLDYQFQHA